MSSFYEDASLVMIPSGYKTSKVYSAKPTDGAGDLSFTRSNDTATRVNSAGLIEKVRTNLVLQSETFDNASWAKTFGASITANTAANPLTGTQTADTIIADAVNNFHYISQSVTYSAGEATISVYLKANGYSWFVIDSGFSNAFGYFNITTGAVGTKGSACTTAITSVGNGWYRCSVTFTATASASSVFLSIRNADNGGSFLGDGVGGFFIYGAQAEMGVATNYIATTSAAVSVGPVANVPRLDYLNSSCPRLLLEPQRTNTLLLSEQLDVLATWSRGGVSVTANNAVSPDGYSNADLITADGTTTQHYVLQVQSGAARTYSIFLKMGTQRYVQILTSGTAAPVANYDLQSGVANMVGSSSTASIENYGNGWYRCILSTTDAAAASFYLLFASSITSGRFEANNSSGTIWAYGAQAEVGAYATSYIPTLGAAVTRGADAASKTSASALIGQTEGTIFLDFVAQVSTTAQSHFWLGSVGNEIGIYGGGSFIFYSSGGVSIAGGSFVTGQRYKIAFAYKANDYVAYVNGVQKGTDTSATVPATSALYINSYSDFTEIQKKEVNQALLFKTRLTNAQMQELTSL